MEGKQGSRARRCTCGASAGGPFVKLNGDTLVKVSEDGLFRANSGDPGDAEKGCGFEAHAADQKGGVEAAQSVGAGPAEKEPEIGGDDNSPTEAMGASMTRRVNRKAKSATSANDPKKGRLCRAARERSTSRAFGAAHAPSDGEGPVFVKEVPDNPFGACAFSGVRRRRASSIKAEEKIRRQIALENAPAKDAVRRDSHQRLFCGLPSKRKALQLSMLCNGNEGSLQSAGQSPEAANVPLIQSGAVSEALPSSPKSPRPGSSIGSPAHKSFLSQGILQDKTNSPGKSLTGMKSGARRRAATPHNGGGVAGTFFLRDLEFLKEKKKAPKSSRRYIKLKKRNTQYNQGYTTVTPRKKAVIDLFTCPKAFFRHSTKPRVVHFDNDAPASSHNRPGDIRSILVDDGQEPSFRWEADKECIDIIRRVDLGSDISIEDFVFKRSDRSIES